MQNPYGTSPIVAMFQGVQNEDLFVYPWEAYAQYGCIVSSGGQGVLVMTLNTGMSDNTVAAVVSQFGVEGTSCPPLEVQIAYATHGSPVWDGVPGNNVITITFGAPSLPPGLINVVVYGCYDEIDNDDLP